MLVSLLRLGELMLPQAIAPKPQGGYRHDSNNLDKLLYPPLYLRAYIL